MGFGGGRDAIHVSPPPPAIKIECRIGTVDAHDGEQYSTAQNLIRQPNLT
jgi:hypothetical protein